MRMKGTEIRTWTPKPQAATLVVAAHDSLHPERADYVGLGVGDNVTVPEAIGNLPTVGGKILLMEGHHYADQLTFPSNIVFSGVGPGSVLKLNDGVNDRFIENADRTGGNSNIVVENMYIDGNKDGQTAIGPSDSFGNAGCLDFRNVTNLAVRNCLAVNGWAAGIETTLCNNVFAVGNYICNSADDGIGINDQTFRSTIANNIIIDAGLGIQYGSPCGIEIQDGSHDFSVIGNVVKNPYADGIQVSSHPTGLLCYNGEISANVVEGGQIQANGASGNVAYGIGIIGNVVNGYMSVGNSYYGIQLGPFSKKCIVSENIVSNTTGHGIIIRGINEIINENILYDHTGNGLNLYNDSDSCIVSNNQIINCATPFLDTGSNNKVFSNIGIVTENSGTATLVNGTTSIAVTHGLAVTPVAGDIVVTPIEAWGNMTQFYIDTYTSTQFTIHANINPGQDVDFVWKAIVL